MPCWRRVKQAKGPSPPLAATQASPERAVPGESSSGPSRRKRYRRAFDDDEAVALEPDDRAAASREKSNKKAGASVAIKPERWVGGRAPKF